MTTKGEGIPTDKASALPEESTLTRLRYSMQMLHVHGLLTDSERRRINARLLKRTAGAGAEPRGR